MVLPSFLILLVIAGCAAPPEKEVSVPPEVKKAPPPLPKEKPSGCLTHKVKRGETVWGIARTYGVTPQELISLNGIKDTRDLEVGQELIIHRTHENRLVLPRAISSKGFSWPLQGKVFHRFGEWNNGRKSTGIDIEAEQGQTITASKGGVVEAIVENPKGWGKVVVLRHDGGYHTWYAYNSRVLVSKGNWVKQGQPIAEAGQTGKAQRPELHFKVFYKDKPVDPLRLLP
ncbi:MAG: murein hydrolase activator EnvC family protein [Candidatus Brocadiales bacterium]